MPELWIDFRQRWIIMLDELQPLVNHCQNVIWALAATPIFPFLVHCVGQTCDVERTVGMLETFSVSWLRCIWVQFPAPRSF